MRDNRLIGTIRKGMLFKNMKTDIDTNFSFDLPKNRSNVMKVMGIGGGGSNAVNYMYKQGIKGVDFVFF